MSGATTRKLILTPSIAAVMALGGISTSAAASTTVEPKPELTDDEKSKQVEADKVAATALKDKEDKEAEDAKKKEQEKEAARLAAEAPTVVAADAAALVTHLKAESAELRTSLSDVQLKLTQLTTDTDKLKEDLKKAQTELTAERANVTALSAVVQGACSNMSVVLNASSVGLKELTPTQLADRFNQLDAEVRKNFKPGAASSSTALDVAPKKDSVRSPVEQAMVQATTLPTRGK